MPLKNSFSYQNLVKSHPTHEVPYQQQGRMSLFFLIQLAAGQRLKSWFITPSAGQPRGWWLPKSPRLHTVHAVQSIPPMKAFNRGWRHLYLNLRCQIRITHDVQPQTSQNNFFHSVCVCVFSSHSFWTSSSLDVPAGVTQEEGHTGFLIHFLSAVRALLFLARRNQPFLSLVDRQVEFCVLTI